VGRYVVDRLVEQGIPVTRAVREVAGSVDEHTRRFDFSDASTWGPAVEGVDLGVPDAATRDLRH
jgi:uncharacterized protein YbjT (DUF2867 family)